MRGRINFLLVAACAALTSHPAFAEAVAGGGEKQPINVTAIAIFLLFVFATLGITTIRSRPQLTRPRVPCDRPPQS